MGSAWHVPSTIVTPRELAAQLAKLAGAPEPKLERLTDREVTLLSFTAPFWAELSEMNDLNDRPYLLDATRTEQTFGIAATPLDQVLAELAATA